MIPGYIQAILALAIVIILFVVGFMIYNYEYLKAFRAKGITKQKVVIFEGVKDLYNVKDDVYPTQDKNSAQYRDLTPSYNQQGGTEMTYNFWMYMADDYVTNREVTPNAETDVGLKEPGHQQILFVRGSTNRINYPNICKNIKHDIMVKCPLVKLEDNGKVMTVEFNTLQGTDAIIENAPPVCSELTNNWYVANAHKIAIKEINSGAMVNKFNMYTIIIQDTYPTDPHPYRNKVRCRIFVNGQLKFDKYVDGVVSPKANNFSTLKTNVGNLTIAPMVEFISDISTGNVVVAKEGTSRKPLAENKLRLANLSYFNYAIPQAEIDNLFASGYDNKPVQAELSDMPRVMGGTGDGIDIRPLNASA